MLYRVSGLLFFLFGCFLMLGHLLVGNSPRAGGGGFASDYSNLITGAALFAIGLYVCIKCPGRKA
ncbi:MAG TPA: hypothetical protein VD861_06460 [Pyrinomonadaceae bacterium]|nr:hypothetical protein [Pyrinomonadaceae bacterium]